MPVIVPLSRMIIGEEGEIVQIDPKLSTKLAPEIQVGISILVIARKELGPLQEIYTYIQVGGNIYTISEVDATLILVKVRSRDFVLPSDRPEFFRPWWPYIYWGAL